MKDIFLFITIILCFSTVLSQQIDKNELVKTKNDFESVVRSFKKNIEQKIKISKSKIEIDKKQTDSIFSAERWAKLKGTEIQSLQAQYQVLYYYDVTINNPRIIEYGTRLLSTEKFLELPESSITARIVLGAYRKSGFYAKQLEIYPIFKQLNKIHGYNARIASISDYHELALIYYNLKNYKLARENYTKQYHLHTEEKDAFRAASQLNNIALTYEGENDFDNALMFYNKSIDLLDSYNEEKHLLIDNKTHKHFRNVVVSNIASLRMQAGDLNGLEQIFKAELHSSKNVREPRITVQAYLNLSEYYFLKADNKLALIYNDSALAYFKTYKEPSRLSRLYNIRAKVFLLNNDVAEAQKLFNTSVFINDSISNSFNKKRYNETALNFDLEVTSSNLEKVSNLLNEKTKINYYQLAIIIIILLMTVLLWRQNIKIKKRNQQIKEQQNNVEDALRAKQIMLDEIHHRIKNNLQVVSGVIELKSVELTDDRSIAIMKNAQHFIQSMVFVHQHLYAQDEKTVLKMQSYFEDLGDCITQNYDTKEVLFQVNAERTILNSEDATPLGLITSELITNSMKHAFDVEGTKGEICIDFSLKNGLYTYIYQDNGCGFDFDADYGDKHQGNLLIKMLIEELEAEVYQSNDNGYQIKLIFNE